MLWVAIPGHHPDIRNHKMVPIGSNSARRGVSQLWNQNQNSLTSEKRETSEKGVQSSYDGGGHSPAALKSAAVSMMPLQLSTLHYARSAAGHQSPRSNSKPPTSGLFGNSRLRFVATVSSRPVLIRARQVLQEALLVPPTHCHASIRTLIGPLWARCKLGFGLMPRSMFGADIFGAIS